MRLWIIAAAVNGFLAVARGALFAYGLGLRGGSAGTRSG